MLRKYTFILLSILKSNDRSAYFALWLQIMRLLLWPLDLALGWAGRLLLPKKNNLSVPIIIVVGIHRTGSTLISQVLSDHFPLAPLGNFFTLLPRSKYLAQHLGKYLYGKKTTKPPRYRNYYGISAGLFSIGDAYPVWDQWFGNDHYHKPDRIKEEQLYKMKNYFSWMHEIWGMPLLVKNNRNSLLITELAETFPNSIFVVVERDPAHTIRSTIQASKDFFGNDDFIWGLKPTKDFDISQYRTTLDAYCHQFLALEQLINKQLSTINEGRILRVKYEDFCDSPSSFLERATHTLNKKYEIKRNLTNAFPAPFVSPSKLKNSQEIEAINDKIEAIKTKGLRPQ